MWNYNFADAPGHQHRLSNRITISRHPIDQFDFASMLKAEITKKYGVNDTRASMDFRFLPVDVYEKSMTEMAASGHMGIEYDGDLLHKSAYCRELIAAELLQSRESIECH